jgi:hypothetical protein
MAHSCHICDTPPNDHCLSHCYQGKRCKENLFASVMGASSCHSALVTYSSLDLPANQPEVNYPWKIDGILLSLNSILFSPYQLYSGAQRYWEMAYSCHIGDTPPNDHCLSHWYQGKRCKENLTLLASASIMGASSCHSALVTYSSLDLPANQPEVNYPWKIDGILLSLNSIPFSPYQLEHPPLVFLQHKQKNHCRRTQWVLFLQKNIENLWDNCQLPSLMLEILKLVLP